MPHKNIKAMMKRSVNLHEATESLVITLASAMAQTVPGFAAAIGIVQAGRNVAANYTDYRFCEKLYKLLSNIQLSDEEYLTLCRVLAERDLYKDENIFRLFDCINTAQTFQQIHYMSNATRYFASALARSDPDVNLADYFRVITVLCHAMPEDIVFLKEHIKEDYIDECIAVEGLAAAGVMWHSGIDAGGPGTEGHQQYSFNKLAELVYNYACLLDDTDNNPAGKRVCTEQNQKVTIQDEAVSDEEIERLFQ